MYSNKKTVVPSARDAMNQFKMANRRNNANILTMGSEMISLNLGERTVQIFLTTDFEGYLTARLVK